MKMYHLPKRIEGFIFDIDNTLYRNEAYGKSLEQGLYLRLAQALNKTQEETAEAVQAYMTEYAQNHGGKKPTMGNTFLAFGISLETNTAWREELLNPEEFLSQDERLRSALLSLSADCSLAAVTNSPTSIGRRILKALGVADLFPLVTGLDKSGVSKPHEKPFLMTSEALGIPCRFLVAIGDRYEVDVEIPLALGMGGILVETMEDVYALPETLKNRRTATARRTR